MKILLQELHNKSKNYNKINLKIEFLLLINMIRPGSKQINNV